MPKHVYPQGGSRIYQDTFPTGNTFAFLLKHEVPSFYPTQGGGTERLFLHDIQELRKEGLTILAFARFASAAAGIDAITAGSFILLLVSPLLSAPWSKGNRLRYALQRFFLLTADVLYTFRFAASHKHIRVVGYSTLLLPLFHSRAIITMQDVDRTVLFPRLLGFAYRRATYLFCSSFLLQSYQKRYPSLFHAGNSRVLYIGVPSAFHSRTSMHRRKDRVIRFLYCGAWAKEKGLDVLLTAFTALQLPQAVLTIAGHERTWRLDFPYEQTEYIRSMHRIIRSTPHIQAIGEVSREALPALYRRHDYTIVPSMWEEPFGMVVLESISCGTPVIAFSSGGIPEIISPENGIVIPKGVKPLMRLISSIVHGKRGLAKPVFPTEKNQQMDPSYRIRMFANLLRNE